MWPSKRFIDLLGLEHPIIQSPMAGTCTPALAAAVSQAGGLGSLGVGPRPCQVARDRVAELRQRTDRPFNLNYFVHPAPNPDPAAIEAARAALAPEYAALGVAQPADLAVDWADGFNDAQLETLLDLRPAVATFHFGLPPLETLARIRAAGVTIGANAASTVEAEAVEAAGCDFVIAQGFEAGGHRGSHAETAPDGGVGLMALVPQVVDAVSISVVAAGGIADARGIVAAFALGADAVQLGTAFLLCPEAETDAGRRARLARAQDAGGMDVGTIVTPLISGRSNRVSAGRSLRRRTKASAPHLPFPLQYALTKPLQAAGDDALAADNYGQAAALTRPVPARDLMESLINDAKARFHALSGGASR